MGNLLSQKALGISEEEIGKVVDNTNFNRNQVIRLFHRFSDLDRDSKGFLSGD